MDSMDKRKAKPPTRKDEPMGGPGFDDEDGVKGNPILRRVARSTAGKAANRRIKANDAAAGAKLRGKGK